jgi:5-deoxy-glucuronate isomerase
VTSTEGGPAARDDGREGPAGGRLIVRAGPPRAGDGAFVDVRPEKAGWSYIGFAGHALRAGQGLERPADGREVAVVALEGTIAVQAGGEAFTSLGGRDSVFAELPPELVLVAPGEDVAVRAETDALVAVADAPAGDVRVTRAIGAGAIRVEERGTGSTARRVRHLLPPDAEAGRLILVEVITPGGNWSSYPPHKHDVEDQPRESYLEELYLYRFARPEGWAFHRVYTKDGHLDEALTPRDRDVVLVPRGYHPVGMPAGYDGYYLNVMAGPTRMWHFTLDPDHAWLMDWAPSTPR